MGRLRGSKRFSLRRAKPPRAPADTLCWSPDRRFGIAVSATVWRLILEICARSRGHETGGILIGRYAPSHDLAIVEEATPPPPGSRASWFWFHRSPSGLSQLLAARWLEGLYYLGEWHFHPGGSAEPSGDDLRAMRAISRDEGYRCPEPLMLIVAGDPASHWTFKAFVIPRNEGFVELVLGSPSVQELGAPA